MVLFISSAVSPVIGENIPPDVPYIDVVGTSAPIVRENGVASMSISGVNAGTMPTGTSTLSPLTDTNLLVFSSDYQIPSHGNVGNDSDSAPDIQQINGDRYIPAGISDSLNWLSWVMDQYHNQVDVYSDADAAGNHFSMRAITSDKMVPAAMNERWTNNPHSGVSCIQATFTPNGPGSWGGWIFMNGILDNKTTPEVNWGDTRDAGVNLNGATTLTFWARGENGGEVVDFFMGGIGRNPDTGVAEKPYPDSSKKVHTGYKSLNKNWTKYTITCSQENLHSVIGGFGWVSKYSNNQPITFYLDDISYNLKKTENPRFLVSYQTILSEDTFDVSQKNVAYTYDNVLALLAYLSRGEAEDIRRARLIADGLVYAQDHDRFYSDGRLRNAYQGGDIALPTGWFTNGKKGTARVPGYTNLSDHNKNWNEDPSQAGSDTGNQAWAIIGLLSIYENTKDLRYLNAAIKLGNWIEINCEDTRGSGGFTGGFIGWEGSTTKLLYKSTEHNLDLYAAYSRLAQHTGDERWNQDAEHAKEFVLSMWDVEEGKFFTGTETDGVTINKNVTPLDCQTWTVLSLKNVLTTDQKSRVLQYVEEKIRSGDGYSFGYSSHENLTTGVWFEGTGQMALSCSHNGLTNRADSIIQFLSNSAKNGALNATDVPKLYTGFSTYNGEKWNYFQRQHIGATAWKVLAEEMMNPFWPYSLNITTIYPSMAPNSGNLNPLTIMGKNFKSGAVVHLINSSISIPGTVSFQNNTVIRCSFPLTGAPTRVYNLTIMNTDGTEGVYLNGFTITNATPTITSVSPTPVFTTTDTNLTITGTNFRTGVTAILTNNSLISDNLTGTNLIKTGTTKIQYIFPTEGQPAGKYNLTVTNIDGTTITRPNIFELKSPATAPNITLTSPLTGKNNAALPITITGSGFRGQTATTFTGITVTLENKALGTTFTGTPTTGKVQKSNQLFYTLPLTGKPAGIYNLTVRNYDGSNVTNTSGFLITTTNPTVSAISPAIGYTTKDQPVTLTGTNFRPRAGVTLVNGSISYNGTGVTVASPASLTCTFPLLTLPEDVTPGTYNVTVTNADGASGTKTGAFTITTPVNSPVITKISPTSGLNNAGAPVTITGKNFLKPVVTITNDTMSRTAKATAGKPQSTSIIYYTLPLTGLEPGSYRMNVTNQYGLNATISFPVNPTKPTITKISPVLGYTTGDTPITITGTSYRPGAEVNLSNATTRLLATSTGVTPTTITCSVPTTGMTAGTYNLTVTNTDGTNVTKPSGFTVKNPGFLPTITGISPNISANSAARAVMISGTNLSTTGARVKLSTDGYPDIIGTPTAGKTQTSTRLYYTLPLTGVPDGKYTLTVINKDGLSVTRSDFFTVTASKPSIAIDSTTKKEKISPISAFNTSPVNITILGTNFRNGVQVNLTNMSAVVEGRVITRTNTQIVSQFSVSGIPAGKYNLTIRNTDGTNVTAKTLFDVKKPGNEPVISSITPPSAFNSGNLAVTITGKYFNKPKVFISHESLSKTAVATANKISTTTTLYVTLPLTGVPGGLYNLTVRNADGASTMAEGIFWVTDKASVGLVRTSPVVGNSARMPVMQVPQIARPDGGITSIRPQVASKVWLL